ncbi:MAG TPA: pantoate--beta-alanine ligase, partial [Chitinophagaceae bacterium]|nr:pantoate--beta-alanine ligase [Chitinophagaceae bacterium]
LLQLTERKTTTLHIVPTEREQTGLAMSSRNLRLSDDERAKAVALYQTLVYLKTNLAAYSILALQEYGMDFLKSSGFDVDYVAIVDATNLQAVSETGNKKLVGLIAATIGNVRLIDNMLLN